MMVRLTQHELSEDPHDVIANRILGYTHGLTGSAVTFAALYLLVHGIVKIVLVAALLRNQAWAYPWMIGFLVIFIGYQLYRLALDPTFWLTALTVFDALMVWLTWREWRRQSPDRTVGVRDPTATRSTPPLNPRAAPGPGTTTKAAHHSASSPAGPRCAGRTGVRRHRSSPVLVPLSALGRVLDPVPDRPPAVFDDGWQRPAARLVPVLGTDVAAPRSV